MESFVLREGVSFCDTSGRLVFLDLASDLYSCLTPRAEASFRRLIIGERAAGADKASLSELVECGLLETAGDGSPPVPCHPPLRAEGSLVEDQASVPKTLLLRAIWRLARANLDTQLRPLSSIVRCLRDRKAETEDRSEQATDALRAVAAAFEHSSLIAAPLDRCLPRSIAASHMLLDFSILPDLVIAVRLQPFSAHCWVQYGATLVNETVDRARTFTLILVV